MKIAGWLLTAALLAWAVTGPAWFWRGGSLELEALEFIPHYTANAPALKRILDPDRNDFDTYQARELSYAADFIDAAFYKSLRRHFDRPLFVPLSALVAGGALVLVLIAGIRRTMPGVHPIAAALLTACLVTSFTFVSTLGVYYRSSKPLLAVVILLFLFHVLGVSRRRSRAQAPAARRDAVIVIVLGVCGGLLDRQGFFLVMFAAALLGVHWRLTGELRDLFVAAVLSASALLLYNVVLGPLAIHAVNGYWPDFTYQRRSFAFWSVLAHPRYVLSGAALILENIGGLFGGTRSAVAVAGTVLVVTIFAQTRRALQFSRGLLYAALLLAGGIAMYGLMIYQHQPIEWIDHRFWYYPLPIVAITVFGAAVLIDHVSARISDRGRITLMVFMAVAAVFNILDWRRASSEMTSGPWFGPVYSQSELLRRSIAGGRPDPALREDYRRFFDYDRSLR